MSNDMSNKLTVREGLIQIVSVERFQSKPRSGGNTHVVVMERRGGTLRHYCTLRSDSDRLSIGEQFWGSYVCYVVDLNLREFRINQQFPTHDRITNIRVVADVIYRATDGERVTLGVDDALQSLHEDAATVLRREIARLPLEHVTEERLETRLNQESPRLQSRMGIAIERSRVRVEWPEGVLERRKAARAQERKQKAEDAQRERDWMLADKSRRRDEKIEMENIAHVDRVIQALGLGGLSTEFRLYLYALPREEALKRLIEIAAEQRERAQEIISIRMKEEYALLRKLIDDKVLEEMDLADFGKELVERYRHSLAVEETFGMTSGFLFGDKVRPQLDKPSEDEGKASDSMAKDPDLAPEGDEDSESDGTEAEMEGQD